MSPAVQELLGMGRRELMSTLRGGGPIDPHALDDTEYMGISLGLPAWVEKLTWKKFEKTFHRDPDTGALRGWNVRLEQNDLDDECVPKVGRDGRPVTFGHYEVVDPDGHPVPAGAQGLLIHYGRGLNRALDPMNRVRDPIVALSDDAELLLGWSYVDLGFARLGTPSFFALLRDGALTEPVRPPRSPQDHPERVTGDGDRPRGG